MSFIEAFIHRLSKISCQKCQIEIQPYLDGYVGLLSDKLSLLCRRIEDEALMLSDDDVNRLADNLCVRLKSIEHKKCELYYFIYQNENTIENSEIEILSNYLIEDNQNVSVALLMEEIRKIKYPQKKGKPMIDSFAVDSEADEHVAASMQLISPYQENAFSSYTLHMVVNQGIGFYLPDNIWEIINNAFENYWDNEIGEGNYFDNDGMYFSLRNWLTDAYYIIPNELLYKIVVSITAFIDSIPGVVIHDE